MCSATVKSIWSFGNNYLLFCKQIHIFKGHSPSCWESSTAAGTFPPLHSCLMIFSKGVMLLTQKIMWEAGPEIRHMANDGRRHYGCCCGRPEYSVTSLNILLALLVPLVTWRLLISFFPAISHAIPGFHSSRPTPTSLLLKTEKIATPVNLLRCGSEIQHAPRESFPGHLWLWKRF